MMTMKKAPYSWWFDSHNSPRHSSWLQTTLSELDEKTRAMLKVIEEDADSFAQRAEMYYKKRPELVTMVEEFYRAHRSLAEKYDQLKTEVGSRALAIQLGSPLASKCPPRNFKLTLSDKSSVASSDYFETEVSEVDDPEPEDSQIGAGEVEDVTSEEFGGQVVKDGEEVVCFEGPSILHRSGAELRGGNAIEFEKRVVVRQLCFSARERELSDEVQKLKEELARLKEDNATQKAVMKQKNEKSDEGTRTYHKDREVMRLQQELNQVREELEAQKKEISGRNEEKREAIRQLCLSLEMLKEDNSYLKTCLKDVNKKSSSALDFKRCFSARKRELSDEVQKLKEELARLKEDNATQKAVMKQKNEKSDEGTRTYHKDREVMRLQQELNQVREELEAQKEISGRNEEKREAIRQLCLSLEMLKEDNSYLKTCLKDVNKKSSSALDFKRCFSARERELSDEVQKLKEELAQLKEDNATQKAVVKQKNEKSDEGTRTYHKDREVMRLQQELNQVREELEAQKKEISGRNEEKREAIRQLCLSLEMLKEDNSYLKTCLKDVNKKSSSALDFKRFRGMFARMFQPSNVAL